ncbi:gephyrin-like molybdotransferase Glp [Terricaulis sp.]|uniref:molybdopterin molybdotransferase MoeA n=1 Tax=Terricaulis sp. TaxID=2768686 RepID=UPI00378522E0
MISVAEARAIIIAQACPLPDEVVELETALGRTLREPVVAGRAHPPFAASAMDGYALRSADTPGRLRVVGEAGAGHGYDHALGAGECARIFTGAPLPAGADAVLIQEDAERNGDEVSAPPVESRRHIRAAGVDFAAGTVLLTPGAVLRPVHVALAAAAGRATLRVTRAPRVTVLSGGDEIVPPGATPGPHQIFDSVNYGVCALVDQWGAEAARGAPFADNSEVISRRVSDALVGADIVVVIGGASVGDHDHARAAVRRLGGEFLFEKVSLRPGKPTWFARCEGKLVLGLPGNPASALVCAQLFLRPLVERILGRDTQLSLRAARTAAALPANGPRETYLRARLQSDEFGQTWATCPANQDSSLLSVFAASNALMMRAANAPAAGAGDIVKVLDF